MVVVAPAVVPLASAPPGVAFIDGRQDVRRAERQHSELLVAASDSLSSCASGLHDNLDAALSVKVRAIGCAGMTRGGVCDVGGLPGVGLSAIHGPLFVNSEAILAAGHRPRMKCSAQVIFGATLEPT